MTITRPTLPPRTERRLLARMVDLADAAGYQLAPIDAARARCQDGQR